MRPPLPPGPFLVLGLARSGVAAALALAARGHRVLGVDARDVAAREELEAVGVEVHAPSDDPRLLEAAATVVESPGVPHTSPMAAAARARGLRVVGELELAWRLLPNPWIAVTGSNGKTTTSEWIGHVHACAGVDAAVAGNVGTALCSLAGTPGADAIDAEVVVVAEASSFQLEDTAAFAPDAAVLLNVTDDHLDRHGTLDAYRDAKLQAFSRQPPQAVAVIPVGFEVPGAASRVTFGFSAGGSDASASDGMLSWRGEPLLPVHAMRLRGAHNVENALATAAACLARGIARSAVSEGLRSFGGVPHRLEEVARVEGVLYVNDSKATNVASAVMGITSFERGVHLILGGRGKEADYAPLAGAVAGRCRAAYLIGEEADPIAAALAPAGISVHRAGDLEHAVALARARARAGDVVLLSPACASYDQYSDFEARGEHFRRLVGAAAA